ncbi:Alanine--tRNA ligase [Nymphon striatum]|nr:Alanine--tRNA ligase [Nymphon striatum]
MTLTLMFTNAGMNQFKEFFLGNSVAQNVRVADSQKCLRVSGKHNDLEEVGKDTYHHTMFEMLGNWSFGDYFKEEAIQWAWEFLTDVCKIDKDSFLLYLKIASSWVTKRTNFWEMGDQGPCGPCSEIHVDLRSKEDKEKVSGASLVNEDHPLVVEIWNLVFMQYNRKADGKLEALPAKHVDTGMGFERLCMAMQGVESNYDTDVFTPIIREIETITNSKYENADGQLPSNTGAGYVIRRILRRAIRYGFTFLDTKQPFMYRLVNVLSNSMGDAFPELKQQKQLIENVIKEEENSFLNTLEQGLVLLDSIIKSAQGKEINGRKAFELYDTYGFPIDLTALILSERGYSLDEKGFEVAMQEQKNRSKSASATSKEDWTILSDDKEQEFVGYDLLEANVNLVKYRKITSKKDGEQYQMVFNLTPFYAEGGGQVGDKGYLEASNGDVVYIIDTKKENNEIVHFSKDLPAKTDGVFKATVDKKQRLRTEANHTATHLLHQALREILGTHVEQKGSAVHSKYLRFDFSHFSKLTVDELRAVEDFVNARIEGHLPFQENRNVPIDKALKDGAMALFGEKYGDAVRTEGAVAAGIRRIEAITYDAVKDFYFDNNRTLFEIKDVLNQAQDPLKADKAKNLKGDLVNELEDVNGIQFLAKEIDLDAAGIKDLSFEMGQNKDNLFLLFGTKQNGKALLSCYISKELVASKDLNAGTIVRELGKFIQGGGGGQPFFATAGGKNPDGIKEALENAKGYLK